MKIESVYEDYKQIIDENASHYALISEDDRKQIFFDFKTEFLKVKMKIFINKSLKID